MIGFNYILLNGFKKYIQSMSTRKDAFGPLLYSTVFTLLEQKIMTLRMHVFPTIASGQWGNIHGGLRYSRGDIKFVVWIRPGYDIDYLLTDPIMGRIYKRLLACLLHEGLIIYNRNNNGVLINDKTISDWYINYFSSTIMKTTDRSTAAKLVANLVGPLYAKTVYDTLERPLLFGRQPDYKKYLSYGKTSTLLKGGKLIKKYAIEALDSVIGEELPKKANLDLDTYDVLEKYLDTFGEFVQFIYENYNTQFKPEDLEADVTESDLLTGSYSSITKYALGHVASIDAFDGSYKAACGLKDVYASGKFFRKDFVFNELYMPTSILAKKLYFIVSDGTEFGGGGYQLIDCATKGLGTLLH